VSHRSPLLDLHRTGDGLLSPYGSASSTDAEVLLVEAFDPVEIEYASIRTHAAAFDMPHRATLVVTGPERIAFLNRMVTQELSEKGGYGLWTARRSFWLTRKGRVDGDLRILNLPDRVLIDVDVHAAERTLKGLEGYIISEDCRIVDETQAWHRISMHGPAAAAIVARQSEPLPDSPTSSVADIAPGKVVRVRIAGVEVIVDRYDLAGEIGLHLLMPVDGAKAVYEAVSETWSQPAAGGGGRRSTQTTGPLARRIGWHALNIARIEAGSAMYLADFGPDSLPHETGSETLNDRVSFKKGCYLGQEIVARMNALGHPKQRLVGLRIELPTDAPKPAAGGGWGLPDLPQAVTGTVVVGTDEPTAPPVGAVTSSCMSPMLGQTHVAFAMVKWSHAQQGTKVWVQLDDRRLAATVSDSLVFWKR
jgi:folate-binding protein YgfZ